MCIVFTCGEHTFRREVEGYESVICRCYNCGNYSGRVIRSHPWFTFCFVPVIPLSIHGYEEVTCHVCNFSQALAVRGDVQAMRGGVAGPPGVPPGMPMQPPLGFNQPPPPGIKQPPETAPMRYG